MNRIKLRILFFSIFLILIIGFNYVNSKSTRLNKSIFEASEFVYDFRIDYENNMTTFYISVNNEVLDFKLQCFNWGVVFGEGFQGLIIELKYDKNLNDINNWIILSGDIDEHHFTTEIPIQGIIQVVFSSLKTEFIDFRLTISDEFPFWAYNYYISNLELGYFGIERSIENYSSIQNLVFSLRSDELQTANFSIYILTMSNFTLASYTNNFESNRNVIIEFSIEESFLDGEWYRIKFDFKNYNNTSPILCQLYYDHFQFENIGRLFYKIGTTYLSEIPVDHEHSQPSFLWSILEPFLPPPPPPPTPNFLILLMIVTLVIFSFIFIVIVVTGIRVNYKKKKIDLELTSVLPSDKYHQIQEQRAEYSPVQVYGVNFAEKIFDYNIETPDEIKVTCSICLQIIDDQEHLIRCPSCDIAFHKNHLYQWIVGNGNCPACKSRLKITKF